MLPSYRTKSEILNVVCKAPPDLAAPGIRSSLSATSLPPCAPSAEAQLLACPASAPDLASGFSHAACSSGDSHPLSCCLWPWSRSSGENAPLPDTQKHSIHLQAPVVGLNRLFLDCGWLCQIHNRPPPWLWGLQQVLRASVTSVRNEQAWLFSCTGRKGHFFRSKSLQKLWEICFKDWHYTNTSVFKKAENSRRVGFLL